MLKIASNLRIHKFKYFIAPSIMRERKKGRKEKRKISIMERDRLMMLESEKPAFHDRKSEEVGKTLHETKHEFLNAIRTGDSETVQLLLNKGCKRSINAVKTALDSGHKEIAALMFEPMENNAWEEYKCPLYSCQLTDILFDNFSPDKIIEWYLTGNQIYTLSYLFTYLLKNGRRDDALRIAADQKWDMEETFAMNKVIAEYIVYTEDLDIVKILIENGCDILCDQYVIEYAVLTDRITLLEKFIEMGFYISNIHIFLENDKIDATIIILQQSTADHIYRPMQLYKIPRDILLDLIDKGKLDLYDVAVSHIVYDREYDFVFICKQKNVELNKLISKMGISKNVMKFINSKNPYILNMLTDFDQSSLEAAAHTCKNIDAVRNIINKFNNPHLRLSQKVLNGIESCILHTCHITKSEKIKVLRELQSEGLWPSSESMELMKN